jgi:hypothetical protein
MEPQIRSVSLAELRGLRVPGLTIPIPIPMLPSEPEPKPEPRKLPGNMAPGRDLTGCRFGALIVIGSAETGYLRARCDCGKETVVARGSLLSNNSRSCGLCHAFGPRGGARRVRPEPEALIECRAAWEAAAERHAAAVRDFRPPRRPRGRPPSAYLACQAVRRECELLVGMREPPKPGRPPKQRPAETG